MKTMKSRRGGNDRGGIRKRGPTRTDRDGDMDMDGGGARAKRNRADKSALGGRAAGTGAGGRPSGSNRGQPRNKPIDSDLIQRAIYSADSQANVRDHKKKTGGDLELFSVRGWKSSKAASNRDGGLESLIAFLERRMNSFIKSGPRAKITKVCSSFTMAVTNIGPRRPPLQCPLVFEDGPHTKRRSTHSELFGFFPFG
jgi:hypothetical protein